MKTTLLIVLLAVMVGCSERKNPSMYSGYVIVDRWENLAVGGHLVLRRGDTIVKMIVYRSDYQMYNIGDTIK